MKLAIIGCGLIGTSTALASRRAWPDVQLVMIDRDESLAGTDGADVIVLAAPVDAIVDLLSHHAQHLDADLILDTGSTKRAIVAAARAAGLEQFVGGHPMAGGTGGAAAAGADLFDGKPWFLTAAPRPAATSSAERFVRVLGAHPVVLPADGGDHDRMMAAVSHLPQVAVSVLMTVVGDALGEVGMQWSGSGLRDTTRLAASPASMWQSVLATNADELRPLLVRFADELRAMADRLDDAEAVRRLFEAANSYRRHLD